VLSSTWRLSPADTAAVNGQLVAAGLPGVLSCTGRDEEGLNRAVEIHTHLQCLAAATSFVILDDQPIFKPGTDLALKEALARHLVAVDPAKGLTMDDVAAAAKILALPVTEKPWLSLFNTG